MVYNPTMVMLEISISEKVSVILFFGNSFSENNTGSMVTPGVDFRSIGGEGDLEVASVYRVEEDELAVDDGREVHFLSNQSLSIVTVSKGKMPNWR